MLRLIIVLSALFFTICTWGENVLFNSEIKQYNINEEVTYFCDTSISMSIDQVKQQNSWKVLPPNANFGFSDAAFWFKVTIENKTAADGDLVFSIPFPNINFIDYFEFTNDTLSKTQKVGELRAYMNRSVKHRYFLFDFRLASSQAKTFYFKVYNNGDSLHFPLELYERNSFIESDYLAILLSGLYLGVIIIIIIFNLFYYKLRTSENIYYMLYVFFTLHFMFVIDGHWASMYNGHWLYWQEISPIVDAIIVNISFLRFTRYFLKISTKTHRITYAFYTLEILNFLFIPFIAMGYPLLLIAILGVTISIELAFILNLAASFIRYRERFEQARYFLIAYAIGSSGVFIYTFRDLNLISDTVISANFMKITFLAEAIILWLAVLHRFKLEQKKAGELLEIQQGQIQVQNEELEKANRELEKLSIVASETDNSVSIFSPQGNLEWVNLGFEKIHGQSLRRLQKEQNTTMQSIYNRQNLFDLLHQGIAQQEAVIFESSIMRKDQRPVWITTTITPYFNKAGELQKIIAIDSNITLLKEMNEELNLAKEKAEESNRLKTNFLSNISHELRTPLNAIIGFSQLLLNKDYSNEKQKEFLRLINSNGSHLLELICDIIDVSRIESGSYINQPIHFNVNKLLKEIHINFEQQLKNIRQQSVRCELSCAFPDSRAMVYFDQLKLKQIFINVVGNAMKFTESGAIIIGYTPMRTATGGTMLEFWVEDTGVGIPEDKLDVVFQRFRQANDNQDRPFNGAGLGLTISKGLIEIMGGSISIQSYQGKGTRVSFTLPYTELIMKEVQVPDNLDVFSSLSLTGKKILIVEDEYSNYEVLYETLVDSGAIFLHATTGDKALKLYDQTISIVLLDIKLPDMSGIDVAKRLKEIDPKVKIIFQTAFALRETKDECLALGCLDFFTKPIEPHLIVDSLQKHIGSPL